MPILIAGGGMSELTLAARLAADGSAALARYLADAGEYTPLSEEDASLPLCSQAPRRAEGGVLHVGTKAVLLKAGTGYAYQRVLRGRRAVVGPQRTSLHRSRPAGALAAALGRKCSPEEGHHEDPRRLRQQARCHPGNRRTDR